MKINGYTPEDDRYDTIRGNLLIWLVQQLGGSVIVTFDELQGSAGQQLRMEGDHTGLRLTFTVEQTS